MTFSERMKDLFEQGAAATKEFAVKAGTKAQDMGERGVLMVEIKQLESQAQKLIGRLGNETYQAFSERGETALSAEGALVKSLLAEITEVKKSIENKEAELKHRKEKP